MLILSFYSQMGVSAYVLCVCVYTQECVYIRLFKHECVAQLIPCFIDRQF